ncbi:hypothetical protein VTJ04DRAFT_3920 [Mycothermus thermophilus]|uniref:uncharacterized protein n=1 Tax=Humicola insolens TaxID=85995 RepID=UPI003742F787
MSSNRTQPTTTTLSTMANTTRFFLLRFIMKWLKTPPLWYDYDCGHTCFYHSSDIDSGDARNFRRLLSDRRASLASHTTNSSGGKFNPACYFCLMRRSETPTQRRYNCIDYGRLKSGESNSESELDVVLVSASDSDSDSDTSSSASSDAWHYYMHPEPAPGTGHGDEQYDADDELSDSE